MKKKLSLIVAFCLLAAFQYCFAQQSDNGYKLKNLLTPE